MMEEEKPALGQGLLCNHEEDDEDSCGGYGSNSVDTWMTLKWRIKQKILFLFEEAVWLYHDEDTEIIDMMSGQLPKETMGM